MIFSHPLIENKKIFNTNPKKEARIIMIFIIMQKSSKLKQKEIILKIHPRVSKRITI